MASISTNFNPKKPIAILMRGRPDEPDSWQSIGVYSHQELQEFRAKGWQPDRAFMERADRARRKDA
jgi:hypothetical protein